MSELPREIAASLFEEERREMISSARLLHTRLAKLIEEGQDGRGFDLPTIVSMLARMRDSIETYRTARAVYQTVSELDANRAASEADRGD